MESHVCCGFVDFVIQQDEFDVLFCDCQWSCFDTSCIGNFAIEHVDGLNFDDEVIIG